MLKTNMKSCNMKKSHRPLMISNEIHEQGNIDDPYEGQRLDDLLDKISRSIELAKLAKGDLPHKIWIKQQFAIGVNEVTRLLERMPRVVVDGDDKEGNTERRDAPKISSCSKKVMKRRSSAALISLQAVIVAGDCTPKWLTKHIPALASTRNVPVIIIRDGKGSSFRLGGLLNLTTALAIGVKARGSCVNATVQNFL